MCSVFGCKRQLLVFQCFLQGKAQETRTRVATWIKFKSCDSGLQYNALLELIDFEDCVNPKSDSKNERI
jgi:hypothetical protein